jgi:hypothetical protein
LHAAPPASRRVLGEVCQTYRPLRAIGEHRPRTNTNRDYVGVLRTIGPDQPAVDRAAAEFLATHQWDIRP